MLNLEFMSMSSDCAQFITIGHLNFKKVVLQLTVNFSLFVLFLELKYLVLNIFPANNGETRSANHKSHRMGAITSYSFTDIII